MPLLRCGQIQFFASTSQSFLRSTHTSIGTRPAVVLGHFLDTTTTANLARLDSCRDTAPRCDTLQPRIKALLIDAAGTLISPSEAVAEVYQRYARPYGCRLTQDQILLNFRRAFNEPWRPKDLSYLRYDGEARDFWQQITRMSTGCDDDQMHNDLYAHFATAGAWKVTEGAVEALKQLRASGVKLAVVSNFDTRLRPILRDLDLLHLFDSVVISAEVKAEKPNPVIFEQACAQLGVHANEAVVLGDDRRNDVTGGRDAGCYAWLYGIDVDNFEEAATRLLDGRLF